MFSRTKLICLVVVVVFAIVSSLLSPIVCPPVNPTASTKAPDHETMNETLEHDPIFELAYSKYLRQVVNVLETDPEFKKIIEGASADDIKSGKIAEHLDLVGHSVRTKLDELKRLEIDRLKKLISRKVAMSNLKPHEIEQLLPKHVDHENIETFEVKDLEKLIRQAATDLEEVDRLRREEFKEHEMQKELERRKRLEKLSPEARKKEESAHEKVLEERKHHERINHPGSKDQMEEVWKDEDHLDGSQFNPETFFDLRDMDGNGYLDEFEIEAMFQHELDKIFKSDGPEYDPAERIEEANRMREHVFSEIDKDKDKIISKKEFMDATSDTRNFEKNEEWKTVEDEPVFNKQEFEDFSKHHMEEVTPHTEPTPAMNQNQQNQAAQPAAQAQHQAPINSHINS